jgi:hypothetical protein
MLHAVISSASIYIRDIQHALFESRFPSDKEEIMLPIGYWLVYYQAWAKNQSGLLDSYTATKAKLDDGTYF